MHIADESLYKKAIEALRYFFIESKQCRGLAFDHDLLRVNVHKLADRNIFVKNIPHDMTLQQLHDKFSEFGAYENTSAPGTKVIKSAKISINEDHTSAGYGFVCFEEPEPASRTLDTLGQNKEAECYCQPWKPRDVREVRKLFNNLYVKNYPVSWRDDDLHNLFFAYGDIGSLV